MASDHVCPNGCSAGSQKLPCCPAAQRAETCDSEKIPRRATSAGSSGADGTTAYSTIAPTTSPSRAG